MGRYDTHSKLYTGELPTNTLILLERVNKLLYFARAAGVNPQDPPVNSGWRPPDINSKVEGASKTSLHMTCQAIDLADPNGDLDKFCFNNQYTLTDIGLWLEHPDATPRWCHLQSKPPRSGNRVFRP